MLHGRGAEQQQQKKSKKKRKAIHFMLKRLHSSVTLSRVHLLKLDLQAGLQAPGHD